MEQLIYIERKRVLNSKFFIFVAFLVLLFSILDSVSSLKNYNVYDQYGNLLISAEENIKESKKPQHLLVLDAQSITDIVRGTDKTRYLYNANLIKLVASNYNKKVSELSLSDIDEFYTQRLANVRVNIGGTAQVQDIEALVEQANRITTPLLIGYAEGWKTLNNDMIDFVTVIIYLIPFIILFIFGKNPKVKMEQLTASTKYGKKRLITAKMLTAFILSTTLYIICVGIYSATKLVFLGFEGGGLSIQSSMLYLFCPYDVTFFEQYLLNVLIGFMALMVLVSLTLFITVVLEQILSSAVILTLLLAIMPMLPNNNFYFNSRFKNFLPFSMTDFDSYYVQPYVYNIFGNIVPTAILVLIIGFCVCLLFTISAYLFKIKKLHGTN